MLLLNRLFISVLFCPVTILRDSLSYWSSRLQGSLSKLTLKSFWKWGTLVASYLMYSFLKMLEPYKKYFLPIFGNAFTSKTWSKESLNLYKSNSWNSFIFFMLNILKLFLMSYSSTTFFIFSNPVDDLFFACWTWFKFWS